MYRNTDTTARRRTAHAIAACALGASIALAGIPAVQLVQPANAAQQAYAAASVGYSADFSSHLDDASAPISLTSSGTTKHFVNMQDAVKYAVENVGTARIVLQDDYTGPAPIIDLPDSKVQTLLFNLNGHTWNVTGDKGLVVTGNKDGSNDCDLKLFGTYGGTLRTDTAKTLIDASNVSGGFGRAETSVAGGTAFKLRGCDFSGGDPGDAVIAPNGTAIEALGTTITYGGCDDTTIEGDIAYGTYNGTPTSITIQVDDGTQKYLSDFKALDGADSCSIKVDGGIWKQKLPDAFLNYKGTFWFSWAENADGTYTLNRTVWGEPGIPAEDQAVYDAWMAKNGSDADAFPGVAAAKAELAAGGSSSASGNGGSSSSASGSSSASSGKSSSESSSSASSKPAPAKQQQTAAQKKAAEQKAQAKALARTKPGKPSAKAYRGHKAKVTFKAAKMPKGVKAKSYQVKLKVGKKYKTYTVKATSSKGKKYAFKVRAVAKIGGKTCYSAWSSYSKSIRAK